MSSSRDAVMRRCGTPWSAPGVFDHCAAARTANARLPMSSAPPEKLRLLRSIQAASSAASLIQGVVRCWK